MSGELDARFWVGVAFAGALIIFFMLLVIRGKALPKDLYQVVRFLTAFCGGVGAACISGAAQLKLQETFAGDLAVSGTSGFAVFIFVFFSLRPEKNVQAPENGGINMAIGAGWTFEHSVHSVMEFCDGGLADLSALSSDERSAPLRARKLNSSDVEQALRDLRLLTEKADAVRPYRVARKENRFVFEVI